MSMTRTALCAALALTLTGCINRPVLTTPPASCARLVPESWSEGVEAVPVPDTAQMPLLDQVRAWAGAYVAMNGQLQKANGRTADTVGIVTRCEEMVNAARGD